MFVERKLNQATGSVELWRCEWENNPGVPARKVYLGKIGDEQPATPAPDTEAIEQHAICWSYGRTLGNIAMFSPSLLGFDQRAQAQAFIEFARKQEARIGRDRSAAELDAKLTVE